MNKLFVTFILFQLQCSDNELKKVELGTILSKPISNSSDTCLLFNSFNSKIRDGQISKQEALNEIKILLPQIKNYYYQQGGLDFAKSKWVFPVQNYNSKAIGGLNGNGYIASGYDYFDGNKHGGHPAYDIFIADKNQDCIDDIKKKETNVLSMTGGIVIAIEKLWDKVSNLRGGKYIWIYDPYTSSFFYYAHNNKVLVEPCDIVKPGDTIATIGRTGLNAFKKRSPTHLHLMQLKLDNNYYPKPGKCYKDLLGIRTK